MAEPTTVLPPGLLERLQEAYATPPRHYHTLEHARSVAVTAAALGGDRPCLLAAWGHDVIYDPTAGDNEARSARWLHHALGQDPAAARAAELVLATTAHRAPPGDHQAAILCDADLSVLGRPPDGYARYREAIRREYAHLDEEAWRAGRTKVLEALVHRPQLFQTLEALRRWEAPARRNLAAELATLSDGR